MLIIEGPDGAGKTTLLNQILEAVPEYVLRPRASAAEGPFPGLASYVEEEQYVSSMTEHEDRWYIYDRHPLFSEPIYGPLIRGFPEDPFGDNNWFMDQWARYLAWRPIIIFCLPPLHIVKENISTSKQMVGVDSKIEAIWWQYWFLAHRMMSQYDGLMFVWNYTDERQQSFFSHVLHSIQREERRQKNGTTLGG